MKDITAVALAANAMATRFEIVLYGDDPVRLRAAGEEALAEIKRLDRQLSRFEPTSDISWINARAAHEPVKVEPGLFRLLKRAAEITEAAGGVFDVTVGPLIRLWDVLGEGRLPDTDELERIRAVVGMRHIRFDEADFTVRFDTPGVEIDLGATGKGYAVDCAVEILRDAGVTSALIHGGTSTIYGLGCPSGADGWKVGIASAEPQIVNQRVQVLRDSSLSVSAPYGRFFERGGRRYGHVIDPRTGEPVQRAAAAAVVGPSAADTDALSTALLVLGEDWLSELSERFAGCCGIVAPIPSGIQVLYRSDEMG